MGWLRVTVNFVLRVTQLDGLSPFIGYGDVQQPLQPPSIVDSVLPLTGEGHYGEGQGCPYTPIVCSYPELEAKGWEFCNTEDSRDCWIRDPNENQPSFTQWDVHTNFIYSQQYPDSVNAPLVIHGPTSTNWDIDVCLIASTLEQQLGPVMISDWIHETAFRVFMVEMQGGIPAADSIVVNGHGHFNGSKSYFETCLTSKKRHVLRLINSSAGTSFVFSIDDHDLIVVTNDLVAIELFTVQSLFIGIGQRYTVIVEAKDQAEGDYWIQTVPAAGCSMFSLPPDNRTGIIRYNCSGGGEGLPLPPDREPQPQNDTCDDVHTEWLNPIVPWCVDQHPQNNVTEDTFEADLQGAPDTSLGPPGFPYAHWFLAEQPMWLNFSRPTILHIDEAMQNPNYTIIEVHCHIAWHASSGLALQILVRPYDIPDFLGDLTETKRICDNWAETPLALAMPMIQDDSGV
ncbi:hypothetical protein DL766_009670 [Monosporascus sp. MC13-8B]|nr:hypothetical protein DL763_009336 [Monosporascus cannonballus]RYP14480.1 hypothetical protein DL766_009670 [Monosporascus sp. MC13-8B]